MLPRLPELQFHASNEASTQALLPSIFDLGSSRVPCICLQARPSSILTLENQTRISGPLRASPEIRPVGRSGSRPAGGKSQRDPAAKLGAWASSRSRQQGSSTYSLSFRFYRNPSSHTEIRQDGKHQHQLRTVSTSPTVQAENSSGTEEDGRYEQQHESTEGLST